MDQEKKLRERLRPLGLHPTDRMMPVLVIMAEHYGADERELRKAFEQAKEQWGDDEDSGDGDVPVREPRDPSPSPLRASLKLPEPD